MKPDPNALAHPRVALTYKIEEGPQVKVSEVFIGGYDKTRRGVIAREVKVKQGEPLREGDVIETQRRLYNLGIFTRVTLAPQNPTGTDPEKAVDVIVEEAKRYTIEYGGGIEVQRLGGSGPDSSAFEASPRLTFGISKANFTGRGDTISFKVRASTLQGRALLSYTATNIFAKPSLSFQTTFFADKSRDVTTFTSTRYEETVQLEQRVSRTTELFYRYTYRKVLVDAATLRIDPEQIPLFSQPDAGFGIRRFLGARTSRQPDRSDARKLQQRGFFAGRKADWFVGKLCAIFSAEFQLLQAYRSGWCWRARHDSACNKRLAIRSPVKFHCRSGSLPAAEHHCADLD